MEQKMMNIFVILVLSNSIIACTTNLKPYEEENAISLKSLIQREYEFATACQDKKDYTTAIVHYRNVLKLDPNQMDAKNNLKVVWDRRITENQHMYPVPFEGRWEYYRPAFQHSPTTVTGYRKVNDIYGSITLNNEHPKTNSRNELIEVPYTMTIPGPFIPEKRIVYNFDGINYTNGEKMGTFYFKGDIIELDDGIILQYKDGIILQYVSDVLTGYGYITFIKK